MRLTHDTIMAAFRDAVALQAAGDLLTAAARWREVVAAAPTSAEAWRNLGDVLSGLEEFSEAEGAYRQAVARRPAAAWSLQGLAAFLHRTGRWREAEPFYAQALALAPDDPRLRLDYGHLKLGLGDFVAGWPLYESRKGLPGQGADPPPLPNEWQGEPVTGRRVLIWPEQGFGDQIQFARYTLALRDLGAEVTLVCPPELQALFAELPVKVVARARNTTFEPPDFWTLSLSTPGRLDITVVDVKGGRYLRAPETSRAKWTGYAPEKAVGIAWRGRGSHPNDAHRSLGSAEALAPLRQAGARLVDLTEPVGDFADLAAIVEQLDLVVSVDTAVAHLAGAIGKPCWVMLPWFRQDWRWLQYRDDSPWYVGHRLFRQAPGEPWAAVIDRIAECWRRERP
jgi:tetratricopeptide (TPR) repeat protein